MQNPTGIFIVLEGSDGSGKGTQFELLKRRLIDSGYNVEVFDFPRYDSPSSHFVRKYLNGEYGPASSISPYTASLFFALDRYEAGKEIRKALDSGKIVLCNRYVGSNMAHQGSKFADTIEKRSFFVWEDSLEYQLLGIPRPNLNLFLRVPAEISFKLISQKAKREYTDKSHDEHEADINHLRNSVDTYNLLCELFPKDFRAIDCTKNDELLDIETISNILWKEIEPLLPYLPKEEEPAAETKEEIEPKLTPTGDLRIDLPKTSLLALFELMKMGCKVNISWDKSWNGKDKNYSWFTPTDIPKEDHTAYKKFLDLAAKSHKQLLDKLEDKELAQLTIPLAAKYSAQLSLDAELARRLMPQLRVSKYDELQAVYQIINSDAGNIEEKSEGTSLKDNSAEPAAVSKIMQELSSKHLPQKLAVDQESKLESASPRNEFELIADGMYAYSELSRDELLKLVETWDYDKKEEVLLASLNSSEVQDKAEYSFDLLTDHISLMKLLAATKIVDYSVQDSTVRYGYEVPEQIDALNLDSEYLDLFDNSLGIFSELQDKSNQSTAKYAVLGGHRVRTHLKLTLSQILEIIDSANDKLTKDLVLKLINLIGESHPTTSRYLAARVSDINT